MSTKIRNLLLHILKLQHGMPNLILLLERKLLANLQNILLVLLILDINISFVDFVVFGHFQLVPRYPKLKCEAYV